MYIITIFFDRVIWMCYSCYPCYRVIVLSRYHVIVLLCYYAITQWSYSPTFASIDSSLRWRFAWPNILTLWQ